MFVIDTLDSTIQNVLQGQSVQAPGFSLRFKNQMKGSYWIILAGGAGVKLAEIEIKEYPKVKEDPA